MATERGEGVAWGRPAHVVVLGGALFRDTCACVGGGGRSLPSVATWSEVKGVSRSSAGNALSSSTSGS